MNGFWRLYEEFALSAGFMGGLLVLALCVLVFWMCGKKMYCARQRGGRW